LLPHSLQSDAPPSRKASPTLNTPSTAETSNSAIPTAAQLAEVRLKQWHQQGEALLTIENLRGWINAAGLVLFAPRTQIASPAPSLVEAVLGTPNPSPTLDQSTEARSLLARLVAEGLAVPLNLLGPGGTTVHAGAPGDTPDFVASTAVFSYIFTLRGDKAWKQPPATSGAMKVSHLALATHEALSQRGPLSAYDLTTEVGKEATEAAVLRALGELWTHLRVLPLLQPDGRPALWELTSARFTKQIKAGANAGQPSALSALISLYLSQAVVAAEDEIESFLSPLASRSRIRDVIHALLSDRQLATVAVEGRTMLHVAGALPAFLALDTKVADAEAQDSGDGEIAVEARAADEGHDAEGTGEAAPRISKFVPKPRKIGTGYLAKAKPSKFAAKPGPFERGSKPSSRPAFKQREGSGFKSEFKPRAGSAPAAGRERRPFSKPASPGFDKPWDEEKARRLAAAARPSQVSENIGDVAASDQTGEAGESAQPRAARVYEPRTEGTGDRRTFGGKPSFRGKPPFGGKPSIQSEGRPPRRDFAPRGDGETHDARTPRKTFSKPGTFGRKREGFAARAFDGDARSPRREFAPRSGPRPDQRSDRGERTGPASPRAAGSYTPRPQGDRPRGDRPQGDRPRSKEGSGFAPRKPYTSRSADGPKYAGKPSFSNANKPAGRPRSDDRNQGSSSETGKRVYRKFDAPRDRPARPFSSDRPARVGKFSGDVSKPTGDYAPRKFAGKPSGKPGGFAGKSGGKATGGFAGKKPFSKSGGSFTGKPTSTFAKFAGNKKPFGKRPPGRKFKPSQGESA
jgi:23S rRNA pseudouridine2605 synthase